MLDSPTSMSSSSAYYLATGGTGSLSRATIRERKISPTTRRFLSGSYSSPQSPKQEVSVALAGPLGCGKSALAVRYLARRFIGEYDPKLEATYQKVERVEGQDVKISVMDTSDVHSDAKVIEGETAGEFEESATAAATAGGNEGGAGNPSVFVAQERERAPKSERYLRWADCLVLVFSVTSAKSFKALGAYLEAWSSHVRHSRTSSLPSSSSSRPRRASHHGGAASLKGEGGEGESSYKEQAATEALGLFVSPSTQHIFQHSRLRSDSPSRSPTVKLRRGNNNNSNNSNSNNNSNSRRGGGGGNYPALVIAAAKCELENAREVSRSDALRLAARHEAALLEVSAAEDAESVDRLFREAAKEGLLAQDRSRRSSTSNLASTAATCDCKHHQQQQHHHQGRAGGGGGGFSFLSALNVGGSGADGRPRSPALGGGGGGGGGGFFLGSSSSDGADSPSSLSPYDAHGGLSRKDSRFSIFKGKSFKGIFQ